MTSRLLAAAAALTLTATALLPQTLTAQRPERAVRRDIPLTSTIRRAHEAGTRDSTGRPGANYWQTRVDYRIDARLDAATSRITASQTATIHNNGPSRCGRWCCGSTRTSSRPAPSG